MADVRPFLQMKRVHGILPKLFLLGNPLRARLFASASDKQVNSISSELATPGQAMTSAAHECVPIRHPAPIES